jgi:hypothetical protein
MMPDPLLMMERESRTQEGKVPLTLADGIEVPPGQYRLANAEFLSRGRDFAIHYKRGEGVRFELDGQEARPDMELVLAGTVRSAIAAINGLFPLHASAVAIGGKVFAFCGPTGSGKSTLVAALNGRSVPLFCDDTLLLDTACSPPQCLPGHKRLKLWPDAVGLAGASPLDLVSPSYRKYYCSAGGGDVAEALPLGGIISLGRGDELAFAPLQGGARIAALADDHYTLHLHRLARGHGAQDHLASLARIAASVPVHRFTRPFAARHFAAATDFIMQQLEGLGTR